MADNIKNGLTGGNKELMVFLTEKFDKIDQRFDAVDQKFNVVDQKFDKIDQRFNVVDQKFDKIDQRFNVVDQKFNDNDKRFDAFQNQHVADYGDLAGTMMAQFEKVYEKFGEIDQKLDQKADKSDIDAVLTRVALFGGKIDDYRAEQIGIQRQVGKHEKWHFQVAEKVGVKLSSD